MAKRTLCLSLGLVLVQLGCANSTDTVSRDTMRVHTLRVEYNNVYAVELDDATIMIDGGLPADVAAVETELEGVGVAVKDVKGIFVTHGHADHAGGAGHFQKTFGTTVIAGAGDKPMFSSGTNGKLCPTDSIAEGRVEEDQAATYTPYEPAVWLDAETPLADLLGIEGLPGVVVPMAGHTPGSLVVVIDDAAFVGDLLRGSIVGSSATTHFYMCDLADNRRDIRELLEKFPAVSTIFPGHFGPLTRQDVEDYLADLEDGE